ncbi:DUF4913 domain-containing protein [Streptomyces sp. NPDC004311]|uniref:DUF4913 domain-containing protein n=1 Tax=Streptomyces sp. NPDC004311 TaxID=3364698 RepID=UPI0036A7594D
MHESPDATGGEELEPVRIPEAELESIQASVRHLLDRSAEQARQLDSLATAPDPMPFPGFAMPSLPGMPGMPAPPALPPEPRPILELEGEEYENELDTLTDWVEDFLMRVYGAEITTASPWCGQWQEHLDVVAWLHALWLAYLQHKEPDAGLAGIFVWHRDCLTHAMAAVRAPGGPLSACQTDPDRPAHRLLRGPGRSDRTVDPDAEDTPGMNGTVT